MVRILVVDDEPMIRVGLAKLIRQSHPSITEVKVADNGIEALAVLASGHVDFVFTDIRMPKMDGLALCKKLYQTSQDVTIVVVSGYGDFEYARECMSYGVKEYLLKPVARHAMEATLQKLITERQIKQQTRRHYIPLSVAQNWLDLMETAVWHLQFADLETLFADIKQRCHDLKLSTTDIQELLVELYRKLLKQLNHKDIYSIGASASWEAISASTLISGEEAKGPDHGFAEFRIAVLKIYRSIENNRRGYIKEPVEEAKVYILQNLSKELTLDEVADMLGFNPSYFSQLFKQMTGETFIHYRIKKRMEKAKQLLAIPHYKITDISYEVGYADHPHFTKTFKKMTGFTPTEYRELLGIR